MAEGASIAVQVEADGSVVVDLYTRRAEDKSRRDAGRHDENLADVLDSTALQTISAELIEGINADIDSRMGWVQNYNEGLALLGLLLEKPATAGSNNTSTMRHPLLAWAIVKFQAMATGELLPADGPVKVKNDGKKKGEDLVAEALERDLNHYITSVDTGYYPDTDRALYYLGYGGTIFKKVYKHPLRKRVVSEAVYLTDLVISNDVVDAKRAARVTQVIEMSKQEILRYVDVGYWSEGAIIGTPVSQPGTTTAEAMRKVTGLKAPGRPEDIPHTVYECYCTLDLGRFGNEEKGQSVGIELPYRVSIDRDTKEVYEVRRNWKMGDENRSARRRFVKWGLIPGIGYLDQGFLNLLGNHAVTATALERVLVDSGIFSIFPGGVRVKGMRMETNQIRPAPGEFPEIDTGGMPINQAVMALPFAGPAAENLALLQHIEDQADRMAGTIDIATQEGTANIPVGTMLASVEQQAQIVIAVHKRLHVAQKEEIDIIRELLVEDEDGLALLKQGDEEQPYTKEQLASAGLVPASDPNIPAHVHRFLQASALDYLTDKYPDVINKREAVQRILEIGRFSDIDRIMLPAGPPPAPPPDPSLQIASMQIQEEHFKHILDDRIAQAKLEWTKQLEQAKLASSNTIEMHKLATADEQAKAKDASAQALADRKAQSDQQSQATKAQVDLAGNAQKAAVDKAWVESDNQARQDELAQKADEAEQTRLSNERIAAMNAQTDLIKTGVETLGEPLAEPTAGSPARDKKVGPG